MCRAHSYVSIYVCPYMEYAKGCLYNLPVTSWSCSALLGVHVGYRMCVVKWPYALVCYDPYGCIRNNRIE